MFKDDSFIKNIKYIFFKEKSTNEVIQMAFISTLVFFFLGNGYAYTNSFPIHDAILFETNTSYGWQISLGRFLLPIYMMIRGVVPIQSVILVLSSLFLSVNVCIVIFLLGIRTGIEIILVCAFLSINVFTLEISAVHQYFSDVFLLSLLLASLGVYCLLKTSVKKLLISFICFFVSFGIYPASFTYAFCLLILLFLRELIDGNSNKIGKRIIMSSVPLVFAGVGYLVASKLVLNILHIVPSKVGWSMFSVGILSFNKTLIKSVITQYSGFIDLFFKSAFFGNIVGVAAIILVIVSLFTFLKGSKRIVSILMILFLIFFPLCSRLVNVMTRQGGAFRTMYAQFLFLPLMVWIFFVGIRNDYVNKRKQKKILTILVTVLSFLLICSSIHYTNMGIYYQKVLYQRTDFHMSRVLNDVLDFTKGSTDVPIRIVGIFHLSPNTYGDYQNLKIVEGMTEDTGITYEQVFNGYARMVGCNINWKSSGSMKDNLVVKAMPCYPKKGYIAYIDDCLVIKLSE